MTTASNVPLQEQATDGERTELETFDLSFYGVPIEVLRSILWAADAAFYLVSTRYILLESNYHYPTCLVLVQVCAALIAVGLRNRDRFRLVLESLSSLPLSAWVGSTSAALSLLCGTQAVLHTANLPFLAMIFTLSAYALHELSSLSDRTSTYAWSTARLLIIGACIVCTLYDEYRLSVNGLAFTGLAMLFASLAVFLLRVRSENPQSPVSSLTLSLLIALVISIPVAWHYEVGQRSTAAGTGILPLLVGNLFVFVGTICTQGSLHIPCVRKANSNKSTLRSTEIVLAQTLFTGITGVATFSLGLATYITLGQLIAYWICTLALAFPKDWSDVVGALGAWKLPDSLPRTRHDLLVLYGSYVAHSKAAFSHFMARRHWLEKVYYGLILCAWLAYVRSDPVFSQSSNVTLDVEYGASSQLDIVVSMYDESPELVRSTLAQLQRIPAIAAKRPSLILYTKQDVVEFDRLAALTGASEVYKLRNQGREGETYLYHILTHWDHLAKHTLFLQADVHNKLELLTRIEQYFVDDTGMLSLGFSGTTCDCDSCGDRWGWTDTSGIISSTYEKVYGKSCTGHRLLLSYKGQFIASAARIRGVGKSLWQDLHNALTDSASWAHEEAYLDGRADSMEAPFFGFTLERMWSMLLQCDEQRIAALCPTLLSGSRRGGHLSDCQCLDPWTTGMGDITFDL